MTIQDALIRIAERQDLSADEAGAVLRQLMEGEATPAQIGGLLVGLRAKGETVDEITGFARTMRELATPIKTHRTPLVDTCGTGGDHSGTFNISTVVAFVVAGAGVAVAKHGNRSATSRCGSADVLEHLGVDIEATPETVGRCIDEVGIGFLYARSLHSSMRHVAGIRAELKTRTVFNLLGPLTNPAGACGQVIGVYDAGRVEDLGRALLNLGTRHAFVVSGSDGLDEITLAGATSVAEVKEGTLSAYELTPEVAGLDSVSSDMLKGGDAARNAEILVSILEGEIGPRRDIVLLNAAAALIAGEAARDWKEGVERAAESVDSGAAASKLRELREMSRAAAAGKSSAR